ncbi:hypothetical protein [Lentzea nigeriaca]|uniref:hypothetical protein n=1 Tax=Lentzea nigeriaca TaxID=1128665 RepID=UPI00195819C7|nr:hypothetical protein [Lentzea nigeriaca]MBM7861897.1 hypothetical protein [Lentzea nigeriaca]
MSNFLQLHSHFVQQQPGGVSVNYMRTTLQLGNGTTVSFQLPALPIGDGLVLAPVVYTEGQTSIRMDFSRWTAGMCGNGVGALLPFSTTDQAHAVRVCRAFHAAPDTSWTDSTDTAAAWLRNHMERV